MASYIQRDRITALPDEPQSNPHKKGLVMGEGAWDHLKRSRPPERERSSERWVLGAGPQSANKVYDQ